MYIEGGTRRAATSFRVTDSKYRSAATKSPLLEGVETNEQSCGGAN